MAVSMTGYGFEVLQRDQTTITVEIRSVNNRYLDVVTKMPRTFTFLESDVKQVIQSYFLRGRVEVYISIEGEHFINKTLSADWNLMDQYISKIKLAKERYGLSGDIPIEIVTAIPEFISIQEMKDNPDELKELLLECVHHACQQVLNIRKREGAFLIKDMNERMATIDKTLKQLKDRQELVSLDYKKRIQKRIEEYVAEKSIIDYNQLQQELAILAEKGDISEEITRLFSHIAHFNDVVNKTGALGRKLDFILQEMHREANTIGAKSVDPQISEWVVNIKSGLEKIKEQVQNIE